MSDCISSPRQLSVATLITFYLLSGLCNIKPARAVNNDGYLYFTDLLERSLYMASLDDRIPRRLPSLFFRPVAVAFDQSTSHVYISGRGDHTTVQPTSIIRYDTAKQEKVTFSLPPSSVPDGLALDPISSLIYYTDEMHDYIVAVTMDFQFHAVIIANNLDAPRALALNPLKGLLFWTDWSAKFPHIGRANMDGTDRQIIVSTRLKWPNGLALDMKEDRLYWCDSKTDMIETSRTDGSDRRRVTGAYAHPFSIVVDDDYVYWTDWKRQSIQRARKDGAGLAINFTFPCKDDCSRLTGLALDMPSRYIQGENACSGAEKGGCEHLCIPSGNTTRTCRCSNGYALRPDGVSCEKLKFSRGLAFVDAFHRGIFIFDLVENSSQWFDMTYAHQEPCAVAADPFSQLVFWADCQGCFLAKTSINSSSTPAVKFKNFPCEVSAGTRMMLTLDEGQKIIYVLRDTSRRISKLSYDGSHEDLLLQLEEGEKSSSIVVHSRGSYVYWSDAGTDPKIEMADKNNGTRRHVLIRKNIKTPCCLTIDHGRILDWLYWFDASTNLLQAMRVDGSDRRVIALLDEPLSALTSGDGQLFWSQNSEIHYLDIEQEKRGSYANDFVKHIVSMAYFNKAAKALPGTYMPFVPLDENRPAESQSSFPMWIIILIVVGVVGFLVLITVVSLFICKSKRRKRERRGTIGNGGYLQPQAYNPQYNLEELARGCRASGVYAEIPEERSPGSPVNAKGLNLIMQTRPLPCVPATVELPLQQAKREAWAAGQSQDEGQKGKTDIPRGESPDQCLHQGQVHSPGADSQDPLLMSFPSQGDGNLSPTITFLRPPIPRPRGKTPTGPPVRSNSRGGGAGLNVDPYTGLDNASRDPVPTGGSYLYTRINKR